MLSCHPIASLWPHCELWHLDHGGRGGMFGPFIAQFQLPACRFSEPRHVLKHGLCLKGFKRWKVFFFSFIFAVNPIPLLLLSIPNFRCQCGSAQKDNCKQANKITWTKKCFGVTSMDFLGLWQHWAPSQVREESSLTETSLVAWSGSGRGGHWRGGKVWGRRGKGTFAVQLAALCEAGTVGRYRAGEESKWEAFSSPLVASPLLFSPSLHFTLPIQGSHFHINLALKDVLCCHLVENLTDRIECRTTTNFAKNQK